MGGNEASENLIFFNVNTFLVFFFFKTLQYVPLLGHLCLPFLFHINLEVLTSSWTTKASLSSCFHLNFEASFI